MPFSFTQVGAAGTPGAKGDPGQDAVLPQDLDTTDSPSFDKIYVTHNSSGTNIKVGDDAWIGDVDLANTISIKGIEDATKGGIVLGSGKTESISSDAHNLTIDADNDVILTPGSTYAYIGTPELDGGNRLATWDYVVSQKFGYFGSFYDTTNQMATASGGYSSPNQYNPAPMVMKFNTTDFSNGVSIADTSKITMQHAGKYNIQFSAQFYNFGGNAEWVEVWLRKNGNDVANSNSRIPLGAATSNERNLAAWNFFVDASANDYYELAWTNSQWNKVELCYISEQLNPTRPAIPSIILTVNQVG